MKIRSYIMAVCLAMLLAIATPVLAAYVPPVTINSLSLNTDCSIGSVGLHTFLPSGVTGDIYVEAGQNNTPIVSNTSTRSTPGLLSGGVGFNPFPPAPSCYLYAEFTYQGNLVFWVRHECSSGVCVTTTFDLTTHSTGSTSEPPPTDGRINWDSSKAGPVAMYCDEDMLKVYDVAKRDGELALTFSDWPTGKPAANTLLKSGGGVSLWHLTTGEFQINADGGEGKTYAFVFNGCPYNGKGYNVNLDPGS